MTRDFNKQQRDDARPPFRNTSSNRYGEERSPHPSRPRLNREMVDRAWENGAPRAHADYHPRTTNGQAPRNNWRNNQNAQSSSYNGTGNYRGNSNRPGQRNNFQQDANRPYNGNQGPRSRSYDANNRYNADDQRFGNRRGYNDEPYRSGGRPGYDNRAQGSREPFRPQGNSRPGFNNRAEPQGRGQGYGRNTYNGRGPERDNGYRTGGFNGQRSSYDDQRPPYRPNPREQSRPWVQREQREARSAQEYNEQYEGDYEHFGGQDTPRQERNQPRGPYQERPRTFNQAENPPPRHVTPLPDGRVLKGPRTVQRKDAQFWTEIAGDADALVEQVHVPDGEVEKSNQPVEPEQLLETGEQDVPVETDVPRKPARRSPSTARPKKAEGKKPRSTGPKPSQRGYKWPAP